ncbi:hypothetical protein ACFWY9_17610 [Amycolatopsis sp. NPDC059027]|uniref:hypothetical protein n=1 Tax=Amycolatopsis sp. NPDC059027 TaxID=3346709 RepID=UPI00366E19A4
MSRTAHHVPPAHRSPSRHGWNSVTLTDLRYDHAARSRARSERRRVRPRLIRRRVEVHAFPRSLPHDREISRLARLAERGARQRLRRELTVLRREANDRGRIRTDTGNDPAPVRHRHGAEWHSW